VTHTTGPRVLDGASVAEPELPEEERYVVAPEKDVRSVPTFSRFEQLAEALASDEVEPFARNAANRLWALLMKRGIYHPLDLDHSDNPPSHPELLDLLTAEFRAMDYDLKAFLRELALTRTYQRSSEPPPGGDEAASDPSRFAVALLAPLSPEQLAWSLMRGLGVVEPQEQAVEAQLDHAEAFLCEVCRDDPDRPMRRPWIVEQEVQAKLAGNVAAFARYFGATEGQPDDAVEANVHQALFLSNGGPVQNWVQPSGRLQTIDDREVLAEQLYLSLLSRRPSAQERAEVVALLEARGAERRSAAIRDLAWALITSAEFRFNH
jgi:hypothetical protein